MMKRVLLSLLLLIGCLSAIAQTNFRSRTSGPWNQASTWLVESPDGSGIWVNASSFPTSSSSSKILIRNTHTITITANISIDQVSAFSGSTVIVNDGVAVTLNNGTGTDFLLYNGANLHLLGESFTTGAGSIIVAGSLHLYSLNSTGAIAAAAEAVGNIRNTTRSFSSGSSVYYSGTGRQYLGAAHPSNDGVNTIINNINDVELNSTSSSVISLQGNLIITQGDLIVQNDDLRMTNVSASILVNGGGLVIIAAGGTRYIQLPDVTVTSGSIEASAVSSALILIIEETLEISGGSITISTSTANGSVTFTDDISLNGGTVSFNTSAGNLVSNFEGDVFGTGTISLTGSNNNVYLKGTGTLSNTFPFAENSVFELLSINRSGVEVIVPYNIEVAALSIAAGTLNLNADLTLTSTLNVASGATLEFSGQHLTARRAVNSTLSGGTFTCDNLSSLTFENSGTIGAFTFSDGSALNNLTLDRNAVTFSVPSAINIHGSLTLTQGTVDNGGAFLSLANGATITRTNNGSLIGSAPGGGPYNVIYEGTSYGTGLEATGSLNNFTSNLSGTLTLSTPLSLAGNLAITTGTLSCGSNSVSAVSLINAGSLNTPNSTSLTLSGDITNSGTISINASTISLGGNWTNTGTTSGTGSFIFTGNTTLSGTVPSFADITIEGIFNAPETLTLSGDLTNNGSLNGASTVVFNGNALQTLTGTTITAFENIEVNNVTEPISLTIESDHTLSGELTLADGATVDADGSLNSAELTLVADASGAARVPTLGPGASIQGNVTIQQYIPAADNTAWYFSSPVVAAPVSQLQDDVEITGYFTGTSYPCTGCDQPGANLKWYDETPDGSFANGFKVMPSYNGSNIETLVPGRGYELYVWNGQAPSIIDYTGVVNQGVVNFTVGHHATNPANPAADGWNFIGNPYPSSIAWGTDGWVRSADIDPTVWVWDVLAQNWRSYSYEDSNPQSLESGIIAPGQGFWVYVEPGATNPTLAIDELAKSDVAGTFYRKKEKKYPGIELLVSGNGYSDHAEIRISEKASESYDLGLDIYKPRLGHESISVSFSDPKQSVFHAMALKDITSMETFVLDTRFKNAGKYYLEVSQVGDDFDDYMLFDSFLGTYTPLNEKYAFNVSENETSSIGRFYLTRKKISPNSGEAVIVRTYPNPVSDKLTVEVPFNVKHATLLDAFGRSLNAPVRDEEGLRIFDMNSVPSGIYFVRLVTIDNLVLTSKVLKK